MSHRLVGGSVQRIGFVVRSLTGGGVGRYLRCALREIDRLDLPSARVYLVTNEAELAGSLDRIEGVLLPTRRRLLFDHVSSLGVLGRLDLDWIVYTKIVIPPVHAMLGARKLNIVYDLGYFERRFRAYPLLDTLYMRLLVPGSCRRATRVIAISQSTRQDLVKRFGLSAGKIDVIHGGVDGVFTREASQEERDAVCSRLGLGLPFLLCPGAAKPRKNFGRVLQALDALGERVPHHVCVTGPAASGSGGVARLASAGLASRVRHLGQVCDRDMAVLYQMADAMLYPSLYEGFGLPILEAQACGCPVLTSNQTSCPEVAGDGALCVDPYSVGAIRYGIESITRDRQLRRELVRKGAANLRRFSWTHTATQMLRAMGVEVRR